MMTGQSTRYAALLLMFVCLSLCPSAKALEMAVPSVSGQISGPAGFRFESYHLELSWRCTARTLMPMAPTGSKRCSKIGATTDQQIVPIEADGRFQTKPIDERRFNFFGSPRFVMSVRFVVNEGSESLAVSRRILAGYTFSGDSGVSNDSTVDRFRREMSSLTIIRVNGGGYPVKVMAAEGSNERVFFNRLKEKYPQSYNFENRLLLSFDSIRVGSQPNVIDNRVEIPPIHIVLVDKPDHFLIRARVNAQIGLVTETVPYKIYRGSSNRISVKIPIGENLEAAWPENFLEEIDLTVNID